MSPLRPGAVPALALALFLLVAPCPPAAAADSTGCRILLLANADHRGELMPCHCPGLEAGSLALRAGLLRGVRLGNRFVVGADAGDFTPLPGDTAGVSSSATILDALEAMGYDAIAPGEAELLRGPEFLAEAASRLPLVCANLKLGGAPAGSIPPLRVIERDGCRVVVTAYVDPLLYYEWPQALECPADSLLAIDPAQALRPILEGARAEGLPVILLAHADAVSVAALLADLPRPDVVVVGHDPGETRTAGRWESVLWVEPGPRSRTVAQVAFHAGRDGSAAVDSFRLTELNQLKRWDRRIEALVRPPGGGGTR